MFCWPEPCSPLKSVFSWNAHSTFLHARDGRIPGLFTYLALGVVIGVFFHYLLYRLSLPLQPFIYVAF